MALKKILRRALGRGSSPATYDCGFDDAEEEVVQQRLQVPGAPGYHKAQSGIGWVRAQDVTGAATADTPSARLPGPDPMATYSGDAFCLHPDSTVAIASPSPAQPLHG